MKNKKNENWLKFIFTFSLIALCFIGLFFIYQVGFIEMVDKVGNPNLKFFKQLKAFVIGIILFFIFNKINPKIWLKNYFLVYIACLVLLLAVLFTSFGLGAKGARRWLYLGFFSFQPTELVKIGLIIYFAKFFTKNVSVMNFLSLYILPAFLILLQPHFSFLVIITATIFIMFFVSGKNLKMIFQIGGLMLIAGLILLFTQPYRLKRVIALFNREEHSQTDAYQSSQVLLALGRGGWFGQGVGNSKQKFSFLPEASSDCLFALMGEEIGFLGSFIILMLYYIFFLSGYYLIKKRNPPAEQFLLGIGILVVFFIQVIFNLAVLTAIVPFTGVPLPFLSYGGTSLIASLTMMGIFLSIINHHDDKISSRLKRKKIKRKG